MYRYNEALELVGRSVETAGVMFVEWNYKYLTKITYYLCTTADVHITYLIIRLDGTYYLNG